MGLALKQFSWMDTRGKAGSLIPMNHTALQSRLLVLGRRSLPIKRVKLYAKLQL
jgi:hypothetical protein